MAEISREAAIKFFNFYNDEECFTEKCRNAHNKAISDMQKLDKIEQIVDEYHNRIFVQDVAFLEIEKVLKE